MPRLLRNDFFIAISIIFSCATSAAVSVYPGPAEALRSKKYRVRVIQAGKARDSFVYADANKFVEQKKNMSDWNHWTTFSFSGKVSVDIELLAGAMKKCTVYPLHRKIKPTAGGNRLRFDIERPAKLFIAIDGQEEDPLFVFADATLKTPNRNDPNVVWFGPGVHDVGKHYQLLTGKTYYLAGGAYVKGSFLGERVDGVTICGPGILSGENIPHRPYREAKFEGVGIHFTGRGRNVIKDVTIINPSQYCMQSYVGCLTTRNVKCFGWWYETDGWCGNRGSLLEDSFFKVNDDVVKLYHPDVQVRNLVIYQQINGAPFQFGWGGESGSNGVVEDIDLIHCEVKFSKVFVSNRAFISRRIGRANSVTRNFRFSRIRADRDIAHIIGIVSEGTVEGIHIQDFTVRGKQRWPSYLKGGTVRGITFENVIVGGRKAGRTEIDLKTQGNVSNVTFK